MTPPLPYTEYVLGFPDRLYEPKHVSTADAYSEEQLLEYGQACRADLVELVAAVHKAKGRYHSQIAMCDLYDACNLPNTRPAK